MILQGDHFRSWLARLIIILINIDQMSSSQLLGFGHRLIMGLRF